MSDRLARTRELAAAFLKLGAISYGGAAIMGVMHAEIAERRRWLTDARYLEGVALVNVLPGPPAVQLAVFIGYERAQWIGGLVAGLCFMLPAFFILVALTLLYSAHGELPAVRNALYGVGAVVLAVFAAAVYRVGLTNLRSPLQIAIAAAAALLLAATPLGVAPILLLAAAAGVAFHHSRGYGALAAAVIVAAWLALYLLEPFGTAQASAMSNGGAAHAPAIVDLAAFFLKVSALTFGGGLAIVAFVQEHVVNRMHWLTAREFLDGLALGQLTPGPTLMIAAYVGYKLAGLGGAIVSALCIFAPAFFLVLPLMPVLGRFRELEWIKAALRGITPAVLGCLVVTLAQLLPYAVRDGFTTALLLCASIAAIVWKVAPLPLVLAGGALGMVFGAIAG